MVYSESMPPSSQSQYQPWLCEFPQCRLLHEAKALHFRGQKAPQVLVAHVQIHQVQQQLVCLQAMQRPIQIHRQELLFRC